MGIPLPTILSANGLLASTLPSPTAVFVGATSGIGLAALTALTVHTATPTLYVVGRSAAKLDALVARLQALNAAATFHAVVAPDLSRVADARAAAAAIAACASVVDLLVLSPGYVTFAPRDEHPAEGVDKLTALRYYSRMAFVVALRAQLRAAAAGRVVSVLAAGKEGPIWRDDLLLRQPGHYGVKIAGGAASAMMGLFFEELGRREGWEGVGFVHGFPGVVSTGLEIGGLGWLGNFLVKWIARPVIWLVGYTQEEAGERVLFCGTSGRFGRGEGGDGEGQEREVGSDGVRGSGFYLVGPDTGVVPPSKEMVRLRVEGMGKVVFDHTIEVLDKIGRGERA